MLELVDAHRRVRRSQQCRVGARGLTGIEIVEIEDLTAEIRREPGQHGGLADGAGPLDHDDWLLLQPLPNDRRQSSLSYAR